MHDIGLLHILYTDISKLIIAISILLTYFVAGAQSLSLTESLFVLKTDVKKVRHFILS